MSLDRKVRAAPVLCEKGSSWADSGLMFQCRQMTTPYLAALSASGYLADPRRVYKLKQENLSCREKT